MIHDLCMFVLLTDMKRVLFIQIKAVYRHTVDGKNPAPVDR